MAGGYKKMAGAGDGKPFKKNDPRINREGRPRKIPDLDELIAEVLAEEREEGNILMKDIIIALAKKALSGDVRAAELIMDRGYGKLKATEEVRIDLLERLTDEQIDQIIIRLKEETNGK